MTGPLAGINVVDISTGVAGGYASKLLTRYGARVTKVEPLGGDPLRQRGPFLGGVPGPERALVFAYLHADQAGAIADFESEAGRALLRGLLADADVLLDTDPPGRLARLGLDQPALELAFPRLVCTTITDFGHDGPYAAYQATPAVLHALGGWVHPMGEPDRAPCVPAPPLGYFMSALYALCGTMEAIRQVPAVGGQAVEVSVQEAITATMLYDHVAFQYRGIERRPMGRRFLAGDPLQGLFPCKDGWCGIQAPLSWMWRNLCDLMGRPDLPSDERFRTPEARAMNANEMDAILCEWAARFTGDEIYRMAQARRLPFHTVPSAEQVFASAHLASRGYWDTVMVEGQAVTVPGLPFRLAETVTGLALGAAPTLRDTGVALHA